VLAAALLTAILRRPVLGAGRPLPRPSTSGRSVRLTLTALGLGAFGYATQATLYFSALQRIEASLVALILYTYPVLVTLAAALLGRDRLTPARGAALVIASCGTLLVLAGTGTLGFDPVGVAFAFGSAVTYTVYILVADRTVQRMPSLMLTRLVMTGAALALTARAVVTGGVDLGFGPAGWFWVACIAVVSTVVAATAFFAGLQRTGPSTASILSTFEPVATAVLAALVLRDVLSPLQVVGAVLVLSSVVLVQLRPRTAPRHHDGGRSEPDVREVRDVRVDLEPAGVAADPHDRARTCDTS
jgi:drug/metabolite transporter (DMT)-like permease